MGRARWALPGLFLPEFEQGSVGELGTLGVGHVAAVRAGHRVVVRPDLGVADAAEWVLRGI